MYTTIGTYYSFQMTVCCSCWIEWIQIQHGKYVSGVSRLIIRRYNHMYTTIGTYYSFWMTVCCSGWIGIDSNSTWTTNSHLKRIISTNCCIHTVEPPDDGSRYARNMQRLTKYTKNKLCIKLVFLYTFISGWTVNKTKKMGHRVTKTFLTAFRSLT